MAAAPVAYRNATANVQPDCPLFAILPAEIRLIIFRYALSASYDVSRPFNEYDFYFRPGHRYDLKIDFTLLLTCRRIYNETALLPASINQAYFWYNRSPPCTNHHVESFLAAKDNWGLRRKNLQIVHLFTQQFWLEAGQFASWTRGMANMQLPRLKTLIITFRYSDWWWWEQRDPPCLDPKRAGQAQPNGSKNAADGFDKDSWGAQLRNMSGLKVFRLELERLASERKQLDAIVERASGWRFETADSVMVLQPSSTRRTAWRGRNMHHRPSRDMEGNATWRRARPHQGVPTKHVAAAARKGRLERNHVEPETSRPRGLTAAEKAILPEDIVFDETESVTPGDDENTSMYYVVTLVWRTQKTELQGL